MNESKKIYRSRTDKILFGVCAGIAKYFEVDPTLIRIVAIIMVFFNGVGLFLYLFLILIMPEEPATIEGGNPEGIVEGASNEKNEVIMANRKNIIGIIIVLLGLWLLINQFYPMAWLNWSVIWPSIIILIGLYLILKK